MDEERLERVRVEAKIVGGWDVDACDQGSFGVRLKMPMWGSVNFGTPASLERLRPRNSGGRPDPSTTGPLLGDHAVIWGASSTGDAAKEVAGWGAFIMAGVGKSTSLVVQVPDVPTDKMRASALKRKLEARRREGQEIRIVTLNDLRARNGRVPGS